MASPCSVKFKVLRVLETSPRYANFASHWKSFILSYSSSLWCRNNLISSHSSNRWVRTFPWDSQQTSVWKSFVWFPFLHRALKRYVQHFVFDYINFFTDSSSTVLRHWNTLFTFSSLWTQQCVAVVDGATACTCAASPLDFAVIVVAPSVQMTTNLDQSKVMLHNEIKSKIASPVALVGRERFKKKIHRALRQHKCTLQNTADLPHSRCRWNCSEKNWFWRKHVTSWSTFSAIDVIRCWMLLLDKGTLFISLLRFPTNNVLAITFAAGLTKFSPIKWGLPAFAIKRDTLHDDSVDFAVSPGAKNCEGGPHRHVFFKFTAFRKFSRFPHVLLVLSF